jgi:HlyD family secretion protein
MRKLKIVIAGLVVASIAGTTWFYQRADGKEVPAYRTAPVARGSIKTTVAATGTLNAVQTVQVGTQVSGQVSKIYVDFNDRVKKGQLLATIDPTLQQQAVEDAQAQLERAQATLTLAQTEYTRNKSLFDARVITASEFATTQSTFAVEQANTKSATIALERAKQNLSYTSIYAPIDGVIVERDVDVGQTVAASLSAPQLFLIANDLSNMQILASVDEGDIGSIKDGLSVQFTVQAYPGETFNGTVKQVRLQSTTTDNVVSYSAVVSVKNDGRLRPGMTATVKFLTASADNVLTVPVAALRINPSATAAPSTAAPSTAARSTAARSTAATTNAPSGARRTSGSKVWTVDAAGTLTAVPVKVGLSDGQKTQIEGSSIHEGEQVVISLGNTTTTQPAQQAATTNNPLAPQRGPGGSGRGGPR